MYSLSPFSRPTESAKIRSFARSVVLRRKGPIPICPSVRYMPAGSTGVRWSRRVGSPVVMGLACWFVPLGCGSAAGSSRGLEGRMGLEVLRLLCPCPPGWGLELVSLRVVRGGVVVALRAGP
jgi:hypothetical protein